MAGIDVASHQALASTVSRLASEAVKPLDAMISCLPGDLSASGISFLELKNHLLLNYLMDMTYLMLKKSFGKKISGDEAIDRLIQSRTFLEKMRPIEKKLKYQVEKYIKIAEDGGISSKEALNFKPNLGALEGDDDDDDADDDDQDEDGDNEGKGANGAQGKYVAPKHVSTFYHHDDEFMEKEVEEKKRKRILSRGIVDELKRQHLDTPEEINEREAFVQSRHIAEEKMRTRFEEENFIRLPVSKKQKHQRREALITVGRLGHHLTHDLGRNDFSENPAKSARKRSKGGKKFSKSKKTSAKRHRKF